MTLTPPRVVFDSVVFVQALISGRGAAAACIERVLAGDAILFISDAILREIKDVPLRPELVRRYPHLTPERVNGLVKTVTAVAIYIPMPPRVFSLPRDPKDEPYTDLAIDVRAEYLVTWNERRLTYLMMRDTPEGREFCDRFPYVTILPPPAFLDRLRDAASPPHP